MELPVAVRLNPFKDSADLFRDAEKVPWSSHGRILSQRPSFTLDPLFHAGCYYVQDSSAMYVGHIFRRVLGLLCPDNAPGGAVRPLRVLDLCAAPGGKTTDLAASLRERLGNNFLLVSNEVMKARAGVLNDNVALWGDPNVVVTSVDPAAFAQFRGFFDIIVADVPCSGEGMFRKDERAVQEWSPEVVKLCAARQKRILADVWPSLACGGYLVYSTCTYEQVENDDNLQWAAEELGGEILPVSNEFASCGVEATQHGNLLRAGVVPGEGQWVGALRRTSESGSCRNADLSRLHPLRNGVVKGEQKGNKLIPGADYALSLSYENEYPCVDVDLQMALKFLHRDSFCLPDAPRGFVLVRYKGHPLGFVNNLGNRCNNLHPQSRRILMNVE